MKSATSSLHHYLSLHPDISMSTPKELHFFSQEKNWYKGIKWYESYFPTSSKIRGESSATYTMYPWIDGVPERMFSVIPEAKLIYILRDPVDRIISQYRHNRAAGIEKRSLSKILLDLTDNQYVYNSKYYTQLKLYLRFYPRTNILIVITEELNRQPRQILQKIFRFLEIDDSFYHTDFTNKFSRSDEKRSKNWLGLIQNKIFIPKKITDRVWSALPSCIYQAYILMTTSNFSIEKPKIDDLQKQLLIKELKNDIDLLRNYTGKNYEYWCL